MAALGAPVQSNDVDGSRQHEQGPDAAARDPQVPGPSLLGGRASVGPHVHQVADAGHDLPHEAPQAFADAVLEVTRMRRGARTGPSDGQP